MPLECVCCGFFPHYSLSFQATRGGSACCVGPRASQRPKLEKNSSLVRVQVMEVGDVRSESFGFVSSSFLSDEVSVEQKYRVVKRASGGKGPVWMG